MTVRMLSRHRFLSLNSIDNWSSAHAIAPPWFLGIVGGAGALTAMVPAAIQLLTGATLYAKNLYRPLLAPKATDQQVARLAKILVLILTPEAPGGARHIGGGTHAA